MTVIDHSRSLQVELMHVSFSISCPRTDHCVSHIVSEILAQVWMAHVTTRVLRY